MTTNKPLTTKTYATQVNGHNITYDVVAWRKTAEILKCRETSNYTVKIFDGYYQLGHNLATINASLNFYDKQGWLDSAIAQNSLTGKFYVDGRGFEGTYDEASNIPPHAVPVVRATYTHNGVGPKFMAGRRLASAIATVLKCSSQLLQK